MIHPDERTHQEEYEHQCLLYRYGQTPEPAPVPDPSEQEMDEMEQRVEAEYQRRRQVMGDGQNLVVSKDVIRLELRMAS